MKKQTYFVFGILIGVLMMITLSIQTARAEEFKFMPVTMAHVMETAKAMKADSSLNILIWHYFEKVNYKDIRGAVDSARAVRNLYLKANISINKIFLGFANKEGPTEEKHKFKTDGVYIQLFRKVE